MKSSQNKTISCALSLLLTVFFIVSCKQNIVIQEIVQAGYPATVENTWRVINALINMPFLACFVLYIMAASFLWFEGYRLLEWFASKHMSTKVVVIIIMAIIVYSVCCIPFQSHGICFALPVALTACLSVTLIYQLFRRFKKRWKGHATHKKNPIPEDFRRQRNLQLIALMMLCIWSYGWTLYFVVIEITDPTCLPAELLFRSALCSLLLFAGNIDSTLLSGVDSHELLKGLISCTGIAALACTAVLILSLALSRLMAYLHLKHILIDNDHNHLYVFFGLNDASLILAKSIYEGDQRSSIVFVEKNFVGNVGQDGGRTDGWKGVVSMLSFRRRTFSDIPQDPRYALAIASCDVCSLEIDTPNVLDSVGLTTIKQLLIKLRNVKDGELHVFFLSENRDSNVRATCILAKDELIGNDSFQTIIYCHARRNGVNRIIEDLGLEKERRNSVKILDSSHLALEHLKRDVKNHPVSFVKVNNLQEDNPGTVKTEFVSLVMGFGETGQEAVKFLYEYGAFIDENSAEKDSCRSPFHCYVLDNEMSKLEGPFVANIPGVECKKICDDNEKLINFYPFDYRSDEFYTKVLKLIAEKLNYVVVAIGNDELNITVAVEILRYVRKKRVNLEDFCIYVRAYEKGPCKYLGEIAKHYNLRLRKDENDDLNKIILFGQNEQIYTYELVIKDEYQEKGKNYYETYRSLQIDPTNDEGTWEERHNNEMRKVGKTKWERMSSVKRKESQDRSNALHAKTKIKLLERVVGKENAMDFAYKALEVHEKRIDLTIHYPRLNDKENLLMLNLAKCEHIRWKAAHEMLGYIDNNTSRHECDEQRRQHNCLKDWQDLDDESRAVSYIDNYKLFDFGVVETTLKLEYQTNQR